MNYAEYVIQYFKEALKKKARLMTAVVFSVLLMVVTYKCLGGNMNIKQLIISISLNLFSGLLIAFPMPCNKYLSIPIILLYILFVPAKLFVRIEYPIHDMSRIQAGAEFANVLIVILIYMLLLLVFQRVHLALGFGTLFILAVSLINFYLNAFRGTCLTYNDLIATKTALSVMDNYQLFMTWELWYSIIYFVFFICLGFWCKIPYKNWIYHTTVSVIAIIYILFFYMFWNKSDYLQEHELQGHYWNMEANEALNGFLLSFLISMDEGDMDKPIGYSDRALAEIKETVLAEKEDNEPENLRPNIIFIMNEAWSDLRVLGNIETTEPFMPFVDSMSQNTLKGNVHVEILGGLTANSEFEALTGDSLAFLAPSAIPYQLQINHPISSIATVLKEQGYQTIAMHPSGPVAWNRNKAYDYMGFDDFIDANDFQVEYEYLRDFISDECNFNEIIYRYEQRDKNKPFFLFNVTIQNHGSYYGGLDLPIEVLKIGNVKAEDAGYTYDLQTYLNLIKITDSSFEQLITYFSNVEEPTIICMFGDHQPFLTDDFYQAILGNNSPTDSDIKNKYITPYVIWANYDTEFEQYGDISANYLGAVLLECANVEIPIYYEFLLGLQTEYPVLSHLGCLDAAGQLFDINECLDAERIVNYRMLQYNHLMEKNWKPELFSINQ